MTNPISIPIPRLRSNTVSTIETFESSPPETPLLPSLQSLPLTSFSNSTAALSRLTTKPGPPPLNSMSVRSPIFFPNYSFGAKDNTTESPVTTHLARLQQQQQLQHQQEQTEYLTNMEAKSGPSSVFPSQPFGARRTNFGSLPFVHRRIHSLSWLPEPTIVSKQMPLSPPSTTTGLFRRLSMGQAAVRYPPSTSASAPFATTTHSPVSMTHSKEGCQVFKNDTPTTVAPLTPSAPNTPTVFTVSAKSTVRRMSTPFTAFGEPDSLSEWIEDDMSARFASNDNSRGRSLRRRSEAPPCRPMSPTSERILQGNYGAF